MTLPTVEPTIKAGDTLLDVGFPWTTWIAVVDKETVCDVTFNEDDKEGELGVNVGEGIVEKVVVVSKGGVEETKDVDVGLGVEFGVCVGKGVGVSFGENVVVVEKVVDLDCVDVVMYVDVDFGRSTISSNRQGVGGDTIEGSKYCIVVVVLIVLSCCEVVEEDKTRTCSILHQ